MIYVLDASALLAVILNEPGRDVVKRRMPEAVMSTVNLAEVLGRCADKRIPLEMAETFIRAEQIRVIEFDLSLARQTADLRPATKARGLSLGDRACIALALREKATIVTADRVWSTLDLGCPVELIR